MHGRQYYLELGGSLLLYIAALVFSLLMLTRHPPAAAWRPALALLPMAPALLACWAILRNLRRLDELQRRLQFEALAFAFAGTALITFSYGFLENVGWPRISMFAVWPVMASLWVIGLAVNWRRYV